ncbi:reverse transcriptase-like protein, partial [Streptomyces sp. MUM 2J]
MREFIVEADGGSRGNPGPAGHGSVVRDAATGETLVEHAEYIGVATNNVAEYRGLVAGLRAAYSLDPAASVHVRMDSKLVVEQMSGRWRIKHPDMKPLAAEAARVFPPGRVDYEWIPRERNKHADRLANEAMDAGRRGERWEPSASSADLATPAGPPGDAAAGASRARAALAQGRAGRAPQPDGPGSAAQADLRAARSVAASTGRHEDVAVRAATAPSEAAPDAAATDAAVTDTSAKGAAVTDATAAGTSAGSAAG